MTSKLSILGLWTWDNTIFDNMVLPSGVDPQEVRDNILYSLADLEVLYPSAPFMKTMIELWSKKELPVWERVYKATLAEYDPIENYNRIEDWTDNRDSVIKNTENTNGTSNESGVNSRTDNSTDEHYVAGYNDPDLVKSGKDTRTAQTLESPNLTTTVNNKNRFDGNGNEKATHSGRVHGNIGVTTSQQMLESELEIAPKLNIVEYIVTSFKMRFCILVY